MQILLRFLGVLAIYDQLFLNKVKIAVHINGAISMKAKKGAGKDEGYCKRNLFIGFSILIQYRLQDREVKRVF